MFLTVFHMGCQTIQYYGQAVRGQTNILQNREPISDLLEDPNTPEKLRERLLLILAVRDFAQTQLKLPINGQYLSYVELNRPYVVWNVFAAPEFSLTPKTWCFPIVGCVAYRGYFAEHDAQRYAETLKQKDYDVFIAGAIAYSTLGWFDDPILSTVLRLSEVETAALIFHELAHFLLFVPDDTAFNESFATAVEQEGLKRWQIAMNDPQIYKEWLIKRKLHQQFIQLILKYRSKLQTLYQGQLATIDKRRKKASLFNQLRNEFEELKSAEIGAAAYNAWFSQPLNNAQIISVSAYHNFVPAFFKLLQENEGNLTHFYQACQNLAQKEKVERHRILQNYLDLDR